jgi:hypothetical protein
VNEDGTAAIELGASLDLRPDELDTLAAVGPEDAARAESLWKAANAGADLAGLLGAGVGGEDA